MTHPWPALTELVRESATLAAVRVYFRLFERDPAIFHRPAAVKETALAREMCLRRATVRDAIRWLIARGFLVDCGRGPNKVRRLQMPLVRLLDENRPTSDAA